MLSRSNRLREHEYARNRKAAAVQAQSSMKLALIRHDLKALMSVNADSQRDFVGL